MQDLRHTMHSTPVNRNVPASIDDLNLVDLLRIVGKRSRLVALGALVIGAAAFGVSFLMTPQFTARTTFIPPQGGTSSLSSMLSSSLGPLAGLAGGGSGGRSGETYVTMLQSRTLRDKLVQRYNLKDLYKARFDFEALEALKQRTRIEYTKKDGVISLEVDDTDPSRAAQIANDYVNELKAMTATMALTDAQRRRKFFELQLNQSKKALADAQRALQASGFDQSALRSEPRAVAEEYGRIKAELTATEVRLTAARSRLADKSPEIQSLTSTAAALRQQLQVLESKNAPTQSQDYVGRYREFKYQETLFEQLSRQYEAARMEESQEDNAVQVLDAALVPEWKSKPKRAAIGLAGALIAAVVLSLGVIIQHLRQLSRSAMNRA